MDDLLPNAIVSENRVRCAVDVTAAAWLLQAADMDGARRLLESALGAVPHDVPARALLGQVLFRQHDFVGASEVFERLLGEFPGDVPLLFNLALCHLKGGRPGPAATTLRDILESRPDHARARAWLRVAEAATPGPPPVLLSEPPPEPPTRASTRPSRLEEVPRVSLPPGTVFAKDDSGVVSLRIDEETRWVVRRSTLEGYSGEMAQKPAAHGGGFVALSGKGTALLRAPGSLVVLELRDEETGARASALAAYGTPLTAEIADPDVVGDFGETILRISGTGAVVLEARAELTALPVSLTHATTVRWDHVVGWTGHVIGAPSSQVDADGRTLARFAGNGALLLAMHDEAATGALASYGRCEVIRRLGGGPHDEILLARSAGPGGFRRKVVLERRLVGGENARPIERLAREAHAYALLTHPAIARLFDFLLIDGHPVIVREYVSGISLGELVTAAGDYDGEVQAAIALYVAHGVLSALAAAHEAFEPDTGDVVPLVHGDVRAGCVLVGWNGDVKVAGFAGARLEAGRPPTMKSDVRATARLLLDMLGPRGAIDPALGSDPTSEVDLRDALARVPLSPVRADRRDLLRDALLAALLSRPGGAPRARELAEAIAEGVDLSAARAVCRDVLGELREGHGGGALSSFPPPAVAVDGDSGVFLQRPLPKPSPVPTITSEPPLAKATLAKAAPAKVTLAKVRLPEPEPARPETFGRESFVTPPPVQPPSLEPSAKGPAARESAKRRRFVTVAAAAVIALASGIASIGAQSAHETAVASEPPAEPPSTAPSAPPAEPPTAASSTPAPSADVPAPTPPAASDAPPVATEEGLLRVPAQARQHRVFLDGRVIGEGPGEYRVRCGEHDVRVGSQGREQTIDVPCGGTVDLE